MSNWQPIETAPNETEVLIGAWIDGEFKWGRSERFYDSGNEMEGEPPCGWVWSIDNCPDSVAEDPTHWQPLPAAPAKDDEPKDKTEPKKIIPWDVREGTSYDDYLEERVRGNKP